VQEANWQSLAVAGAHRQAVLYGAVLVTNRQMALLAGVEASAFLALGAWLVPADDCPVHSVMIVVPRPLNERVRDGIMETAVISIRAPA
jgi:hypothetical protein